MTTDALIEHWRTKPFNPFAIHMADGRSIRLSHPEYMIMSPTKRTVVVYERGDVFRVLDIRLITEREVETNGVEVNPTDE